MMLNYSNKVKPLRPSSHHTRTLALLVEQRQSTTRFTKLIAS
jgi:hypothetical protein